MEAAKGERRQNENSSAAGSKAKGLRRRPTGRGRARGAEGVWGMLVEGGLGKGHSRVALFFLTLKAIKYVGHEQGDD